MNKLVVKLEVYEQDKRWDTLTEYTAKRSSIRQVGDDLIALGILLKKSALPARDEHGRFLARTEKPKNET